MCFSEQRWKLVKGLQREQNRAALGFAAAHGHSLQADTALKHAPAEWLWAAECSSDTHSYINVHRNDLTWMRYSLSLVRFTWSPSATQHGVKVRHTPVQWDCLVTHSETACLKDSSKAFVLLSRLQKKACWFSALPESEPWALFTRGSWGPFCASGEMPCCALRVGVPGRGWGLQLRAFQEACFVGWLLRQLWLQTADFSCCDSWCFSRSPLLPRNWLIVPCSDSRGCFLVQPLYLGAVFWISFKSRIGQWNTFYDNQVLYTLMLTCA